MRVLVAGVSGVIGRRLVPLLTAVGHEVVGLSRATGVDALDREAVKRAVGAAEPEAVVNMLTAIPAELNPRKLTRDFALTNRLRTEGTQNLIEAAPGVRLISQGLAYGYKPGKGPAGEDAPLWQDHPPKQFAPVLAALRALEQLTIDADGLVLRLGHLYGPGSIYASGGSFARLVQAGKVPLVGGGHAVFSFTHADDVGTATAAALDRPELKGVLNVVDDSPAALSEWLPAYANLLKAPAPKPAPAALARLAVGRWGVAFMNELRGADNARTRLVLNWRPRYTSWADGFAAELAGAQRGVRGHA